MTRAKAAGLYLVNWRGVFYERFELNPAVTVLEGENGAGKTTVMIAAYVALMPDQTRLKFTNLGEHGASGGERGLYGRLGDLGRPSYTVLDFRLSKNQRLLAGVHLERKSEPKLELTPFLITGLTADRSLQTVLLDRREDTEEVPELAKLKELVALAGGRLQVLSPREYFGELYEHHVTPLRLQTDDERSKYNELLRTSMVGGISDALASGLREFLLKKDTGLADTLGRMRTNLEACRRTRTEVRESSQLQQEIHGVLEAAQAMFAAALQAVQARASELRAVYEAARAAREEAEGARQAAGDKLEESLEEQKKLESQLLELEARKADAETELQRTRKANELVHDLQRLEPVLGKLVQVARESDEQLQRAERSEQKAREDHERARAEVWPTSRQGSRTCTGRRRPIDAPALV